MLSDSNIHLVKALHNFTGANNDELCFKKGDIITVTQALDGGWWEGTLDDVTGWFPSNYVKEIGQDSLKALKPATRQPEVPLSPKLDSMKMYRGIVFKDIVDTESNHLNELHTLITEYLNPLKESNILSENDYAVLKNNIDDVYACNASFFKALEELQEKPMKEQRIGGVFMQMAPQIKKGNLVYYANHPKAATVIEKHKEAIEKFMEEHGATSPGILTLTTGLSSPFRRLEKYPALLQELQRHTEENHVDRGDTQRAIFVYRDIAAACLNVRRQKENELEVMSGNIRGWEGEDIKTLGEIVYMGLVIFLTEDQEKKDRYLVVFPHNLVILSISPRMSAFVYEGKLPLSGITVKKVDPSESYEYAFEITGNMIQRIIVICPTQESLDQWLNIFQKNTKSNQVISTMSPKNAPRVSPSHLQGRNSSPCGSTIQQSQYQVTQHHQLISNQEDRMLNTKSVVVPRVTEKIWTSWSLKPHPPLRPSLNFHKGEVMLRRSNSRRKERVPEERNYEGDMKILQVIEAYCTSAKTRYTVNSALLDSPQMIIAEEEKIIVEKLHGDMTIIEEKSLVDTVYALKDQIQELKSETSQLFKTLAEERRARKKLEALLQKHIFFDREDLVTNYIDD